MKKFMDENFLLKTETAQELYHNHAAKMPIIDYHCHLIPKMVADDYQFKSITEEKILPIGKNLKNGQKRFLIRSGIRYIIGLIWN